MYHKVHLPAGLQITIQEIQSEAWKADGVPAL